MPGRALAMLALVCTTAATVGFYDIEEIQTIRLYFAEPDWDAILDSLYAEGEEGRLTGFAVINGTRYDSVGVRYKGQSSYNPSRKKNPFNIKLDYVIAGQNIEGHGTLRLANVYKDPSFVREALSYEIARMYMPAGRANFANVYVNDTLIGLYTNNEDPDRRFMRAHFLSDDNARFKGRMLGTVPAAGWKYLGADSTPYLVYYELDSDSGWRELIEFLDTLSNHPGAVEEVLDVDRHLWMLAFDILMVNLDAPVNMPQNFYLYQDLSSRFNPIIWDLNENFGAFRELLGTGQLSLNQMQQMDPFLRSGDPDYPICSRFLSDSRFRRNYVAHMKTLITDVFENSWYRERALDIQDIIDADVRADPNKFYSHNDFENNITRSVGSGPLAIVGLTELMNPRVSWLLARPEFRAQAPVVSEVTHSPARVLPHSTVTISAWVDGADSVVLGHRQTAGHRFSKTAMLDRGDGTFAAAVSVGAGELHYYICALNSNAATFSPARAEFQYHVLPVSGDIAINELLAINYSTIRDPNGEYDDWIELHNNSSAPVSLDGWLLTDDSLDPTRWVFPDTTIGPGDFLAVWADDDTGQPGLHANFQLAGSGEVLVLSDPDGVTVDRLIFGQQSPDISLGRFPDGTGTFRLMNPTFEAPNDSGVGVREKPPVLADPTLERAFPNPFSRQTTISYSLEKAAEVSLAIYDASGREVVSLADGTKAPGSYRARFTAQDSEALPAGVYFARLWTRPSGTAPGTGSTATLKLVLAR